MEDQDFYRKKPPLGLMPRKFYEETREHLNSTTLFNYDLFRFYMIKGAIVRYKEAGKEIPKEWGDEFLEIADKRLYHTIHFN